MPPDAGLSSGLVPWRPFPSPACGVTTEMTSLAPIFSFLLLSLLSFAGFPSPPFFGGGGTYFMNCFLSSRFLQSLISVFRVCLILLSFSFILCLFSHLAFTFPSLSLFICWAFVLSFSLLFSLSTSLPFILYPYSSISLISSPSPTSTPRPSLSLTYSPYRSYRSRFSTCPSCPRWCY